MRTRIDAPRVPRSRHQAIVIAIAVLALMGTSMRTTGLSAHAADADQVVGVQGTPPMSLGFRTTPQGHGQVRLRLVLNPAPLTVSAARPGQPPIRVTISPPECHCAPSANPGADAGRQPGGGGGACAGGVPLQLQQRHRLTNDRRLESLLCVGHLQERIGLLPGRFRLQLSWGRGVILGRGQARRPGRIKGRLPAQRQAHGHEHQLLVVSPTSSPADTRARSRARTGVASRVPSHPHWPDHRP